MVNTSSPRIQLENHKSTTFLVEKINQQVLKQLKEKITMGVYKVGDLIVPQEFQKVSVKGGKIVTKKNFISSKKISLEETRYKLLHKYKEYMDLTTDKMLNNSTKPDMVKFLKNIGKNVNDDKEANANTLKEKIKSFEKTRHLMMWHDCSTVRGHSYLLMMIACIYDPACYYTDTEFQEKFDVFINIQTNVEKPWVYILAGYYILAGCPFNEQQILYSQEKLDDIIALKQNIKTDNIEIIDKMRIFKGDKPAAQFEAGEQKGGNFYCFSCPSHAENASSYVHTYIKLIETISDRINIVKKA